MVKKIMKVWVVCVLLTLAASKSPIKNIVVLMLENRSFDHLLGHLAKNNSKIDGLNGTQYNPVNPADPASEHVAVNYDAVDGGPDDPCHSFDCITQQVYGFKKAMNDTTSPVKMTGFVANAIVEKGSYPFVMSAFNDSNLPVLSTLAREFAVFDHWHCSCPCPTNPNREFLMSGTAHGMTVNTIPDAGFPQETHFAFLGRHNVTWKIYFSDDPWMGLAFSDLRRRENIVRLQGMPHFYTDLKAGTLAQYTLIQPRLATSPTGPSNWQHPDNSVEQGEILITQIYDALKASPYWEDTLLIITYDEHGGFFDHQPTPTEGIPAPDDVKGDNGFDYTRLGVRIPTVMVSPWIAKGTVVSAPSRAQAPMATSQFESTSIISSANKIFGITESRTRRDAWAGTFHDIVSGDSGMRTDCPDALPAVRPLSAREINAEMNMLLNDHHLDSINLLCHLSRHAHPVCASFASSPGRTQEQSSFLARLGSRGVPAAAWAQAEAYPNLFAPAARRLRQKHFEELSQFMFGVYREIVLA